VAGSAERHGGVRGAVAGGCPPAHLWNGWCGSGRSEAAK
jgi:hypothetical protein